MRYVESRGENMSNAIEVSGLTKYYGEKRILSNITFKIKQGEICRKGKVVSINYFIWDYFCTKQQWKKYIKLR